jgi:glycosyltransferase involved in cell wall biosynthesis
MKNVKPEISVGMPVYNGEKYLGLAIESILNQSFPDFELIISDNASTDGTQDICQSYLKQDSRIKYVRHAQNMGGPRNWNYVFKQSSGIFFKWTSANDLCHPDFLAGCKEVLDRRQDVVLCYPRTKLIDAEGNVIQEYTDVLNIQDQRAKDRFIKLLSTIQLNNAQCGLVRSSTLRKTALEGIYQGGDFTLLAELVLHGKFYELPSYLYYRRMSADSVTIDKSEKELKQFNDPTDSSGRDFTFFKYRLGYFKAVFRSPIGVQEKLASTLYLLKSLYWHRLELMRQIAVLMGIR